MTSRQQRAPPFDARSAPCPQAERVPQTGAAQSGFAAHPDGVYRPPAVWASEGRRCQTAAQIRQGVSGVGWAAIRRLGGRRLLAVGPAREWQYEIREGGEGRVEGEEMGGNLSGRVYRRILIFLNRLHY